MINQSANESSEVAHAYLFELNNNDKFSIITRNEATEALFIAEQLAKILIIKIINSCD